VKIANFIASDLVKIQSDLVAEIINKHENIYFSGVGKSAIVARRAVASFISIGKSVFFLDAVDALHGDFGMVRGNSAVIVFSKSNSSTELLRLLRQSRKIKMLTISVSMGVGSLDPLSDYNIKLPAVDEENFLNLPSYSITAYNFFIDLIFNQFINESSKNKLFNIVGEAHPGGKIGASVDLVHLNMRDLCQTPLIDVSLLTSHNFSEISAVISEYRVGCCFVINENLLINIITDGDIRRYGFSEVLAKRKGSLKDVLSVGRDSTRLDALNLMEKKSVNVLAVVEGGMIEGCITISDLII